MSNHAPIAFLSWAHTGNENFDAMIERWKDWIETEVRLQSGHKAFKIFFDRDKDSIGWGKQWEERIEKGIDNSTFLIALLTPLYFESEPCYLEWNRFKNREGSLHRIDLILPVLYVSCPQMNDPSKCRWPEWPKDIAKRQYRNWEKLRFARESEAEFRSSIASLAQELVKSLKADQPVSNHVVKQIQSEAESTQFTTEDVASATTELAVVAENLDYLESNKVITVGRWSRSSQRLFVDLNSDRAFHNINEAIMRSNPGDSIIVRSGVYNEAIVIDKRIRLIGEGDVDEIEIASSASDHSNIHIQRTAGIAYIENLSIRGKSKKSSASCIFCESGETEIIGCKIGYSGNGITSVSKKLTVKDCLISDSNIGIHCDSCEEMLVNFSWIESCITHGIYLKSCRNARILDSRISDNGQWGIYWLTRGTIVTERTEFEGNASGEIG